MGFPAPSIASAGKACARARLVEAPGGAAPARTGTGAAARPSSLTFAAAGARFAGGDRERGGGGATRVAAAAMYTALVRAAIKTSPLCFPSYGGAAVLCLAHRADVAGDGDGGDGAGDEDHGGGGAGAGGDDYNAEKDYALNHCKRTEGAPTAGGGDSGDVGAGSDDMGGAGAGVDRRNAEKAGNFSKVPDAAAGGGRADQACWKQVLKHALGRAFLYGLITVFILASVMFAIYKICFTGLYSYTYQVGKNLLAAYLKDDDLKNLVREAIADIVYPWLPWKNRQICNGATTGIVIAWFLHFWRRH